MASLLIQSLYAYGLALGLRPFVDREDVSFILEIGSKNPTLSRCVGEVKKGKKGAPPKLGGSLLPSVPLRSYALPYSVDRTGNIRPNHGYDNLKNVLLEDKHRSAFWAQLKEDLGKAGLAEILPHVDRCLPLFAKLIPGWGLDKAEGWVVITCGGVPIVEMPQFRDWFSSVYAPEEHPAKPLAYDYITGQACIPVATHASIRGLPGTAGEASKAQNTSLVSFNEKVYGYSVGGRYGEPGKQCDNNFSISHRTSVLYTTGLNDVVRNGRACIADFQHMLFWPEMTTAGSIESFPGVPELLTTRTDVTHPIIPLVTKVLGRLLTTAESLEVWEAVKGLNAEDATLINVLWLRTDKARISVLHHSKLSAATLRNNLLQFQQEFCGIPGKPNLGFQALRRGTFDPATTGSLALAIVLGTPFPAILNPDLSSGDKQAEVFDRFLLIQSIRATNEVFPMARPEIDITMDFPPIEAFGGLPTTDKQTASQLMGRYAAIIGWVVEYSKKMPHYWKVSQGNDYSMLLTDPHQLLHRPQLQIYLELVRKRHMRDNGRQFEAAFIEIDEALAMRGVRSNQHFDLNELKIGFRIQSAWCASQDQWIQAKRKANKAKAETSQLAGV